LLVQLLSGQEPIGLLVGIVRARIKRAVGTRVAPFRLSPQQFWVLVTVSEQPGLSLRELTERHHVDPPTASRIIGTLAERKLVRAEGDPEDRRRSRLILTPSGRALARKVIPVAREIRAAVVDGLTSAEQRALRHGLRKIMLNMDRRYRRV